MVCVSVARNHIFIRNSSGKRRRWKYRKNLLKKQSLLRSKKNDNTDTHTLTQTHLNGTIESTLTPTHTQPLSNLSKARS